MESLLRSALVELDRRGRLDRLGAILGAVDRLGSLNRAASDLRISYRHAWGLVGQAEGLLGQPLLIRRAGGSEGGGAELTPAGRALLEVIHRRRAVLDAADRPDREEKESEGAGAPLLLASTIAPIETGLLDALEAAYHRQTGRWVRHIAAGSGQALDIARAGRADLVLSHAPELERAFVADGWGAERLPLMRNDFLLVGPKADPARAGSAASVQEALRRIAGDGIFISRGDRSGTNLKELSLWAAAGVEPREPWYQVFDRGGQGNAATLSFASANRAYTLADRASYLIWNRSEHLNVGLTDLEILVQGGSDLENLFSLVKLNPGRFSGLKALEADTFAAWAAGPAGRDLIGRYGADRFGRPLFHPLTPK